jgi:heme-degrading monooxygenase HmoA
MHAVIFISQRTSVDDGYGETNDALMKVVQEQPGFIDSESWRNEEGYGVTIVYFDSAEASSAWGGHPQHREAQRLGREKWYSEYRILVCKVERDWKWPKTDAA